METLSRAEARRVALRAQGFGGRTPKRPGLPHLRRLASRLGVIQIDSVNVLVRSHYLPAFSRLGPYPRDVLDRLAYDRRALFEYWGHMASFLPVEAYPLFRWRMERFAARPFHSDAAYVDAVLDEVRAHGPLAASELSDPGERSGPWWGWADGKAALEWLFATGRVSVSGRRGFERLYDVTERVIPSDVLDAPAPSEDEARRELLVRAAGALGVGTARDLADYYRVDAAWERRTSNGTERPRVPGDLRALVEEGRLVPVEVEGWTETAYLRPGTKVPSRIDARALVSPFDPLVWERRRTHRLFDFHYRIEIYVPKHKRTYGYYVLPFVLGDRLVARVDLKADRGPGVLRVQGAYVEPGEDPKVVAGELAAELRRTADWLALDRIHVGRRGTLARELRASL